MRFLRSSLTQPESSRTSGRGHGDLPCETEEIRAGPTCPKPAPAVFGVGPCLRQEVISCHSPWRRDKKWCQHKRRRDAYEFKGDSVQRQSRGAWPLHYASFQPSFREDSRCPRKRARNAKPLGPNLLASPGGRFPAFAEAFFVAHGLPHLPCRHRGGGCCSGQRQWSVS